MQIICLLISRKWIYKIRFKFLASTCKVASWIPYRFLWATGQEARPFDPFGNPSDFRPDGGSLGIFFRHPEKLPVIPGPLSAILRPRRSGAGCLRRSGNRGREAGNGDCIQACLWARHAVSFLARSHRLPVRGVVGGAYEEPSGRQSFGIPHQVRPKNLDLGIFPLTKCLFVV